MKYAKNSAVYVRSSPVGFVEGALAAIMRKR